VVIPVDWEKLNNAYGSEDKAKKAADIVATTEARLANQRGGPQYTVETRIEQENGHWHVYWRKVIMQSQGGCGAGCGSCKSSTKKPTTKAKVIPFKKKTD
jgi:hypothetical protein